MITTKNVLFFSLFNIESLDDQAIYPDLLGEFHRKGYNLFILSPAERGKKINKKILKIGNITIIQVRCLKVQKANRVEKLLSSISLEFLFMFKYYKELRHLKFDLVLFPTPIIFVNNFLKTIKLSRGGIKYLLLKDIFPQNAIDLNFIEENSLITKFFKKTEKKLYDNVDFIGCMSKSNLKYINEKRFIERDKLEVNPNSVDIEKYPTICENKFRKSYNISSTDLVFVYGGNLGKPQGINKILSFIDYVETKKTIHFIICGTGTETYIIKNYIKKHSIRNSMLFDKLNKKEYLQVVSESNMGLVFLHKSFTIPNYPSRVLDYMFYKLPVLCWTDKNSDIADVFIKNDAGFSFKSEKNFSEIKTLIEKLNTDKLKMMGLNAYRVLLKNFQSKHSMKLIENKLNNYN